MGVGRNWVEGEMLVWLHHEVLRALRMGLERRGVERTHVVRWWRLALVGNEVDRLTHVRLFLVGKARRGHSTTIVGHLLAVDELASVLGSLEDSWRLAHV